MCGKELNTLIIRWKNHDIRDTLLNIFDQDLTNKIHQISILYSAKRTQMPNILDGVLNLSSK